MLVQRGYRPWSRLCAHQVFFGLLISIFSQSQTAFAELWQRHSDEDFRSIFTSYLQKSGYSDDEMMRLHLPFTEEFKDFYAYCNQEAASIEDCDPFAPHFTPSQFYEESQRSPITVAPRSNQSQASLILIPGYVAELADIIPFAEVFSGKSLLKSRWQKTLRRAPQHLRVDSRYSMIDDAQISTPMKELILAASLDQSSNQEGANLFVMNHLRGSLESFGSLEDNAAQIIRRLQKLDALMQLEGPVYLVGYSRGTLVALEILSQLERLAASGEHPWSEKIAGMISIGGPIFGTPLSDSGDALEASAGPPTAALLDLADSLQSCEADDKPWERSWKVKMNTARWSFAVPKLLKEGAGMQNPEELSWEGIKPGLIDIRAGWQILSGVLLEDIFQLSRPFAGYCKNIDRFKLFVRKLIEGSDVMSTAAREAWFRQNTLPPHLDYIAVSATMMNASTPEQIFSEGKNAFSYGTGTADLQLARSSFYQIYRLSGVQSNDGFVPVHRSLFLPGLHQRLNPEQEPYQARYIGAIWQHHLGTTLANGIPMANGNSNPFPRRSLLQSLIDFTGNR
ncbi:MAG: hypothetical protein ACOH5I_17695 [Oligoflexus sp.]